MPKVYPNQVTVRVWRNVKRLGAMTDMAMQDKAAEMNKLTAIRLEVAYRDREGLAVPKWWRNLMQQQGRGPLAAPRPGQVRLDMEDDDGFPLWSQSPERKFALPGFRNPGLHWGLSISAMNRWWAIFRVSAPTYQALSVQNCAGVALMALRAGGAEAFVDLPHVAVYAEPAQVERYTSMLATELERMEAWTKELDGEIKQALASGTLTPQMPGGTTDGLWPAVEWKRVSALGPLQPRSATIRAIDDALAEYHAIAWKTGHASKHRALAKVFRGVVRHRQQKADSARSAAVPGLGLQVLATLHAPGPYYG